MSKRAESNLCPEGVDSLWSGVVPLERCILSYNSPGASRLQPEYQLCTVNLSTPTVQAVFQYLCKYQLCTVNRSIPTVQQIFLHIL
jgi:hypothetical protein